MAKNPLDVILGDIQSVNKRSLDVYKGIYGFARRNARKAATTAALANIGTVSVPASIYLSNVMQRSGGGARPSSQRSYSSMKPGAAKTRTGKGGAIVGSTVGGGTQKKTPTGGAQYIGSTVGGNRGGRTTPATQPKPKTSQSRTTTGSATKTNPRSNRTALVKERLRLAEERAARGDVAGAAAFANAALTIQKKGKGTAQSMRRVEKVATTYQQAASAGRKPIKRRKG